MVSTPRRRDIRLTCLSLVGKADVPIELAFGRVGAGLKGESQESTPHISPRSEAISSDERTTFSNETKLLVNDREGGNGSISIDGAGEGRAVAALPRG